MMSNMNVTGQSFNSISNMKMLEEGGGKIRNITSAAENIKKIVKNKLK